MPDTLTLLRELAGADEAPSPIAHQQALNRLQREIARGERPAPRPQRGRRPALLLAPAAVLVLALGGVGYAALNAAAPPSAGIACHPTASLAGGATVQAVDGRAATAICADAWRSGVVDGTAAQAPELQACVDPAGGKAIQVIPATDPTVCGRLGLVSAPQAGTSEDAKRFAAFTRDVVTQFAASACVKPSAATDIVRGSLNDHGLGDWTITTGPGEHGEGFSPARPCASLAFDSDHTTVTLVPDAPSGQN